MSNEQNYVAVETERKFLEDKLNQLIKNIGDIPIANKRKYAIWMEKSGKRKNGMANSRRSDKPRA